MNQPADQRGNFVFRGKEEAQQAPPPPPSAKKKLSLFPAAFFIENFPHIIYVCRRSLGRAALGVHSSTLCGNKTKIKAEKNNNVFPRYYLSLRFSIGAHKFVYHSCSPAPSRTPIDYHLPMYAEPVAVRFRVDTRPYQSQWIK